MKMSKIIVVIVSIPSEPNPSFALCIPKNAKFLFLGAHVDDIEIGAGGFLWDCSQHCLVQVYYWVMTAHNEVRKEEAMRSINKLGLTENAFLYDFPDREFQEHRHQIADSRY
jgi:LmbE family N-acetylglucosaminyl deacetylase